MASTTAGTYLMTKGESGDTYTKLCDITSFPDLGSAPSKIDTTDLSCTKMKTNILGLQDAPDLTFEANYDKATYTKLAALQDTAKGYALYFGDEQGTDGKYGWTGKLVVYVTGGGVDEVRKMSIVISAETAIAPISA